MDVMRDILSRMLFKKTMLLCVLLTLSACTSGPRIVRASLPLVSASIIPPYKQEIPEKYWVILSDSRQSNVLLESQKVALNDIYISALGQSCRTLIFESKNKMTKKRIACENSFFDKKNKEKKGWFLEKMIVDSTRYVELLK
ncbi:hypothetical protein PCNPT3_05430 [Psychromonas sp. CNPT3]|uniref:hypothetical protein n=1 Tax=Psychromonas sp. CNPT3 TaxID=314282 RepID=UPI0002C047D9|nr:hypothetical protein [Psychromonas sp. CNPT3]AGH81028.1 hypothetical protein PCNPT3_05430 [Psychromonas sp. CNPT3]